MIPGAKTVNSIDGIASELNAIIARMADRYYLTFPGYDDKTKTGLPWDGKDHDLVLKNDQTEYEPVDAAARAEVERRRSEGGFPWLVVDHRRRRLILLIIIGEGVRRQEGRARAPMPMPMRWPMPMEAPKPAGPMKTVMIGAGGDEDGFPIVGWIVALNGPTRTRRSACKLGHARRSARRRRPTSSSTTAS